MNCNGCVNLMVNGVDNTFHCRLTGGACYVRTNPHPAIMGNGVESLGVLATVPEIDCEGKYVSNWGK